MISNGIGKINFYWAGFFLFTLRVFSYKWLVQPHHLMYDSPLNTYLYLIYMVESCGFVFNFKC